MKTIIVFLILIIVPSISYTEGIEISQSLSQTEIAFEDSVTFEIQLQWEGPQSIYLFPRPLSPYIDRMKVRGFSSKISSNMIDGKEITQKRYTYTLIPTSAGLGLIDSVSVPYRYYLDSIPAILISEPMSVTIAYPRPKEKKDDSFPYWMVIVGLIVLGGGIGSYFMFIKKSKSKEIILNPKDKFLEDLTELKNSSGNDLKQFQTGLYKILTNFIISEYNIDVSVVDMNEFISKMTDAGMILAHAEQMKKWLEQAEKDKYSPMSAAPGETIRLESAVRSYFEKM